MTADPQTLEWRDDLALSAARFEKLSGIASELGCRLALVVFADPEPLRAGDRFRIAEDLAWAGASLTEQLDAVEAALRRVRREGR